MIDFSSLIGGVFEFLSERKKGILISSILVLFFCAALIITFAALSRPKPQTPPPVATEKEEFIPDQDLFFPYGPAIQQNYTLARRKQTHWSSEEADRFFSVPNETNIQRLSEANKKMMTEIMEAAP